MTTTPEGETLRAFVAIELPEPVRVVLGSLVERLRRFDVPGLRPVRPEGIHLTLKFLGDIPSAQTGPLVEGLAEAVAAHRPFALELSGTGAFPSAARPQVLWVGVEGNTKALLRLHEDIEDALAELRFARDSRRFNPHLTVARLREDAAKDAGAKAAAALNEAEQGDMRQAIDVNSVSLMQSILRPDGAIYHRVASVPLRGH